MHGQNAWMHIQNFTHNLLNGLQVAFGRSDMKGRGASPGVVQIEWHAICEPEAGITHDQLLLQALGCLYIHS